MKWLELHHLREVCLEGAPSEEALRAQSKGKEQKTLGSSSVSLWFVQNLMFESHENMGVTAVICVQQSVSNFFSRQLWKLLQSFG